MGHAQSKASVKSNEGSLACCCMTSKSKNREYIRELLKENPNKLVDDFEEIEVKGEESYGYFARGDFEYVLQQYMSRTLRDIFHSYG